MHRQLKDIFTSHRSLAHSGCPCLQQLPLVTELLAPLLPQLFFSFNFHFLRYPDFPSHHHAGRALPGGLQRAHPVPGIAQRITFQAYNKFSGYKNAFPVRLSRTHSTHRVSLATGTKLIPLHGWLKTASFSCL